MDAQDRPTVLYGGSGHSAKRTALRHDIRGVWYFYALPAGRKLRRTADGCPDMAGGMRVYCMTQGALGDSWLGTTECRVKGRANHKRIEQGDWRTGYRVKSPDFWIRRWPHRCLEWKSTWCVMCTPFTIARRSCRLIVGMTASPISNSPRGHRARQKQSVARLPLLIPHHLR